MTKQLCRSCDAPIFMLKHAETGKYNPINVEPAPNGNLSLDLEKETYRLLSGPVLQVAQESGCDLHISHFATCKFAKQYRK